MTQPFLFRPPLCRQLERWSRSLWDLLLVAGGSGDESGLGSGGWGGFLPDATLFDEAAFGMGEEKKTEAVKKISRSWL